MQLEIVMAFGVESVVSFPVKTQAFFTGTAIFPLSLSFPLARLQFSDRKYKHVWYPTRYLSFPRDHHGTWHTPLLFYS